jgi:lysozyme family protein
MTAFSSQFVDAFNEAMLFEVGPHWDPTDPEVIAGLIETRQQRKKVGYVNIPQDRGGETKYGIAAKGNPGVSISSLDLAATMEIYYRDYWIKGKCDRLPPVLAMLHFDGCVNHGVPRAAKFLQRAAGVTADGIIGDRTLQAVSQIPESTIIEDIISMRQKFYNDIVKNDPRQAIFLNGWMNRINTIHTFIKSKL